MLTRPHASLVLLLPLLLAACQTPPAPPPTPPGSLAQTTATTTPAEEEAWDVSIAPYLWAAGMDGNVTVNGNKLDFSMSFSDILDDLNYAVEGLVEARHGEWTVLLDNNYFSLTADATLSPGPGPSFPVSADAAMWISELAGLHRVSHDSPYEVGAGVRYAELRTDTHIASLPGLHGDQSVTDGIVVGRGTWPINERWAFRLYADAGTGDSDFTWQSAATFLYRYDGWALGMGYRVLDYDIGGTHDTNLTLEGLTLGAELRF